MSNQCVAPTISKIACRFFTVEDTKYCKHHQYFKDYTDEMMNALIECSGCHNYYYLPNSKQCTKCNSRGNKYRKIIKEKAIKCLKGDCTNNSNNTNGYCNLHQTYFEKQKLIKQLELEGKWLCKNHVRGCKNILDKLYTRSNTTCGNCLDKNNNIDKNKRNGVKKIEIGNTIKEKYCNTCCKICPIEKFIGEKNGETKTCQLCRDINKKADLKRVGNRTVTEGYYQRQEVKEHQRQKYLKNKDKINTQSRENRKKRREKNEKEYLQKCAKQAKNWRQNNPDKALYFNEFKQTDPRCKFDYYFYRAEKTNILFELTEVECQEYFNDVCFYCGEFSSDKKLTGIDRLDNNKGYTKSNTVPCCYKCNYMKYSYDPLIFVDICEHILMNLKKIDDGEFSHELFCNSNKDVNKKIYDYKKRIKIKNINVQISDNDFKKLFEDICYICGKKANDIYLNGIDRFDNKKGYTVENCRSCCSTCNYMKKDMDYDDFINQVAKIYNNHKIYDELTKSEDGEQIIALENYRINHDPVCKTKNKNTEKTNIPNIKYSDPKRLEKKKNDIILYNEYTTKCVNTFQLEINKYQEWIDKKTLILNDCEQCIKKLSCDNPMKYAKK
jgi:hypothetical protein